MCPEGSLSKKKFIEVSKDLYGDQAKNLSESIFDIFDEDQSGHIDFVEYMMAINSSNMHTPESKLNWIFNVFWQGFKMMWPHYSHNKGTPTYYI